MSTFDDSPAKVTCNTHGTTPWQGDLICAQCKRIYFDCRTNPMPEHCECCGHGFSPSTGKDFTARVVCRACAEAHREN